MIMKTKEYCEEQQDKLRQSISDFMNDDDISPMEKKDTAVAMAMLLVYKSAINIEEGIGMLIVTKEQYIETMHNKNDIHPN
jgi:hypothetical protein